MRSRLIIALAVIGLLSGVISALVYGQKGPPEPPVYMPAPNPYASGIYATGILESYQSNGVNIDIYPEVAGTVIGIPTSEGAIVLRGDPLIILDASVQRATTEQLRREAEAALATLEKLRAGPRPEELAVAAAQVRVGEANVESARAQLEKLQRAYDADPRSISKASLDDAFYAAEAARANLGVARSQYALTKAGAWSYDIRNQERVYEAARAAYESAEALLEKYTVRAPRDGVVLAIQTSLGGYVSPQGTYDNYNRSLEPAVLMGSGGDSLAVRCYVDEVLVPRLPPAAQMSATMFIRGTSLRLPLEFERIQPFVTAKIQLSNERTERVDVRVLPIVFRLTRPAEPTLYPGQLVDVYIEAGGRTDKGSAANEEKGSAP